MPGGLLKRTKTLVLGASEWTGVSSLCLNSAWRQQRLLILCYHGVSLADEHEWNPELYVPAGHLKRRLELLRRHRMNVLTLGQALEALATGDLPPRSVAVTFDDGNYDFYRQAFPVLREYDVPATVYLTTYYSDFNRPVFDPMCDYLLWKAKGKDLNWPEVRPEKWHLDEMGRHSAGWAIRGYAGRRELSGCDKDALLAELANRLNINYDALVKQRLIQIMTPDEARELSGKGGVDFQLHTHRHRTSKDRSRFAREIDDNRDRLGCLAPGPFIHFCYPGGFHLPEFEQWLPELGVRSATTCEVALASRTSPAMRLPRLVDHNHLTETEFVSWLSGVAQFLPQRAFQPAPGQLMEDQPR
jgi:peptidoglycan/xylan/chitin deacetylase (PgdA/CDA1 family)